MYLGDYTTGPIQVYGVDEWHINTLDCYEHYLDTRLLSSSLLACHIVFGLTISREISAKSAVRRLVTAPFNELSHFSDMFVPKISDPSDGDTSNGSAQPTFMGDASKRADGSLTPFARNCYTFLQYHCGIFVAAHWHMDTRRAAW